MRWIGLSGSIGAGKSTVAEMLRKSGYSVIDADSIAHEGLKSGTSAYKDIVDKFGTKVLDENGEIVRRELGKLIFKDANLKEWLESLLHPYVQSKVRDIRHSLERSGADMAFYEVPLLFEKKLEKQFEKIVVVAVSPEVQKQRLKARNRWSDSEIEDRVRAQIPVQEKIRRADFVIMNDGTREDLEKKVSELVICLKSN